MTIILDRAIYLNAVPSGGGGEGGTSDYEQLFNLPSINGTTIIGQLEGEDLGLASQTDLEEVESIAKGATQGLAFDNYQAVVTALNNADAEELNAGQNLYVRTLNVPDLWISGTSQTAQPYTYTTDDQFLTDLRTTGSLIVGYYIVSELETAKVDLTNYVKNTDYATSSIGGVIKSNAFYSTYVNNGFIQVQNKNLEEYRSTTGMSNNAFIGKGTLENLMETWTFTLEDGTEVVKRVCVSPIGV